MRRSSLTGTFCMMLIIDLNPICFVAKVFVFPPGFHCDSLSGFVFLKGFDAFTSYILCEHLYLDRDFTVKREVKQFILESETEVQTAKQGGTDLKEFLATIRKCTDITELTPTLVNTLIKRIEIFNSVVGADGKNYVPITIHFRATGIITVPDEKDIIATIEEIRNNPSNVA